MIVKQLFLAALALIACAPVAYSQDDPMSDDDTAEYGDAMPGPDQKNYEQIAVGDSCDGCYPESTMCGSAWVWGIDYRYIRPHFSEAVAFATVTDAIGAQGFSRSVVAEELDFDYDSSFSLYLGFPTDGCGEVRLSYWYLDTETFASGEAGAGQTIVDPFGNLGLAGSRADAEASVKMNVFDLEYRPPTDFHWGGLGFLYTAGLRFADVDQFYSSTIANAAGAVTSEGIFGVEFSGVGPYLSMTGQTRHGACNQFSLFAKGAGALLVGQYDVSTEVTVPGATGSQVAGRVRGVPVFESELGMAWYPNDMIKLSAGWMFQAWFNMGASGGTFDGENLPVAPIDTAFGGADDADIMSFDGLFLRAEIGY